MWGVFRAVIVLDGCFVCVYIYYEDIKMGIKSLRYGVSGRPLKYGESTKIVSIVLPVSVLGNVDRLARASNVSRSEYIIRVLGSG